MRRNRSLLAGELVSLPGLRGRPVYDRTGLRVGSLVDLVVTADTADPHPAVQGAMIRRRGKLCFVPEAAIVGIRSWDLYLCTVELTPRPLSDQLIPLADPQ